MENNQNLTKKEKKELKHREKEESALKTQSGRKNKLIVLWAIILLAVAAGIGGIYALYNYIQKQPRTPASAIISRNGIHWHSKLSIYINSVEQEIPANIGIGARHQPIHTHDASGVIHLEFQAVVAEKDTTLGKFFKIWNKQFNQNCIFDSCGNENQRIKMLVNGKENTEFDNYQMQDNDKIEIRYE